MGTCTIFFPAKHHVNLNAIVKAYVFQYLIHLLAAKSVRKRTYRTQNRTAIFAATLLCLLEFTVENSLFTFHFSLLTFPYSVLKLFTGFTVAAFTVRMLRISSAISNMPAPVNANTHQLSDVRKANS